LPLERRKATRNRPDHDPPAPDRRGPPLRSLSDARHIIAACFLGWTLDACDFFIVLFTLDNVAHSFSTSLEAILLAPTLTLISRPVRAYLFGRAADRYGRRPILMATIVTYSTIELLSAFAPNLTIFLALRLLFGVALGGEWGVGTSLTMETVPPHWRGTASEPASGRVSGGLPAGVADVPAATGAGVAGAVRAGGLDRAFGDLCRALREGKPVWLASQQRMAGMPRAAKPSMLSVLRRYRGWWCMPCA
jgi:SHS family lactate transporter-like MFS transporter